MSKRSDLLYVSMQAYMKELAKVSRGRGDEPAVYAAIDELGELGVDKQIVADLAESAAAAAEANAAKCKECATHAVKAAKLTLKSYMGSDGETKGRPTPKPARKTTTTDANDGKASPPWKKPREVSKA